MITTPRPVALTGEPGFHPKRRAALPIVLALVALVPGAGAGFSSAAPAVQDASSSSPSSLPSHPTYENDIRPLLQARCYECHGPEKHKSGLRLDQKASAFAGGESGKPGIVPSKPETSHLFELISGAVPEAVMPPKEPRLTPAQIATVKAWIEQGASWPEESGSSAQKRHWAFEAPTKPAPPAVKNTKWPLGAIDRFILARLEKEGLKPSPEADRITLVRRLYLDLLGLPPTPAEVEKFLADREPNAYERLVDRLLASPHYGERWARHWLDAARYADSDGYEKDKSRQVWFYRDWVIQSMNRDLPYNEFILEQIAGDQLPDASQDQKVATGFLRNSMLNEEGAIDPEQFRMDAMFDRMDAIGKSVLGLTIQCAQCHSHKYDPMTQEEYYRLFAYLNNDHESQPVVYTAEDMVVRDRLQREMQAVDAGLQHTTPDWEARLDAWEEQQRQSEVAWEILDPVEFADPSGGAKYTKLADGSMLCAGYAPTKLTTLVRARTSRTNITAFRLEQLLDPNLPAGGPGRSFKGTSYLTEFGVEAADAAAPTSKTKVSIAGATADFSGPEADLEPNFDDRSGKHRVTGSINFAIDGKDETAWSIEAGPGRRNQDRKAVFEAATNVTFATGAELTFHLTQNHGGWNSDDHQNTLLGRFRLSVTSAPHPVAADPMPRRLRELLRTPKAQRSPADQAALFSYWRSTVPEWKEANAKVENLWTQWPAGSTALTFTPREQRRETHVLKRGDFLKPDRAVTAGVPAFLHPLPADAPPSRLVLGRWLSDRRSPTTARVFVNRIWQAYFGTGLVSTPEDFGMQGERPSHPELLDWLATEFMDQGWSLKRLHRSIVTSAAYRQSSRLTPALLEKDPYNRFLARGPRFRVEAEVVRDIALAASGLLNDQVGGPSVFAPAPQFLFNPPASYAPFNWPEATGPERYRRGMYTFRRRSTPYPMLAVFDAPNGDFSCVRRARSNSPLQALVSLNETIFVECAQALARKTLASGGPTDQSRIDFAFRQTLGRAPTPAERSELVRLLQKQERRIGEGWVNASELATGRNEPPQDLPKGTTPAQLAAYTVVSRALLNLDETITKE